MSSTQINSEPFLDDPVMTKLIIAILVRRLTGEVAITQEEIDTVAYGRLEESFKLSTGVLTLTFHQNKKSN